MTSYLALFLRAIATVGVPALLAVWLSSFLWPSVIYAALGVVHFLFVKYATHPISQPEYARRPQFWSFVLAVVTWPYLVVIDVRDFADLLLDRWGGKHDAAFCLKERLGDVRRRVELLSDEFVSTTALHEAAACGYVDVIEQLIAQGSDIHSRDRPLGHSALHKAAAEGKTAAVKCLLVHGAQVDQTDESGYTPLHNAALHGSEDCAALLLANGASVNARTSGSEEEGLETPLHLAATYGYPGTVRVLLEAGADPSAVDVNGETALHMAMRLHKPLAVEVLLGHGADPNLTDKDGRTPLEYAEEW